MIARTMSLLLVCAGAACAAGPRSGAADGAAAVDSRELGCTVACDPLLGLTCDPVTGTCDGPCAPDRLGQSYVGCEYYATVTVNDIPLPFHFAAVISNPGPDPARVTIEGGGLAAPRTLDVPPDGLEIAELPWVAMLEACESAEHPCGYPVAGSRDPVEQGALVRDGAYRIRSTRPVTVYQFNPLEFEVGGVTSHSNDASLLFPVNAMGNRFVVAARQSWPNGPYFYPGFLSVTSTADDTHVTITAAAPTPADNGAPALAAGVPTTVALDRGDVLQVQTYDGDLTGSFVEADHPVQVIGGHYCTTIPFGAGFCDHLEENHPGIAALGRTYVTTAPAFPPRPDTTTPPRNIRYLRVIATQPETHVAFDPPQDVPVVLANAGDVVELPRTDADVLVHADHPVLVAEYMVSSTAPTPATTIGDPSMSIAVPVEQFRRDYRFHAPPSYDESYVNVVARAGSTVVLDGTPIVGWSPVGESEYIAVRVLLLGSPTGDHHITSSEPFGITVYGYAFASSYWYPGGLDLEPVVE